MENPWLIGIIGPAGAGKSTLARMIASHMGEQPVAILPLANGVKSELLTLCNDVLLQGAHPDARVTRDALEAEKGRLYGVGLQFLGEFAREKFGADIWLKKWERIAQTALEGGHPVIADDVRYANEMARIKELGGMIVKVTRPGQPFGQAGDQRDPNHPSERDWQAADFDYVYANTGTLEDLRGFAAHIGRAAAWWHQAAQAAEVGRD